MTTPIIAGAGVAALALTGRAAILSFEAWRRAPPRMRKFYDGGFDPEMTKREAALILGVRESAAKDKVLAAHLCGLGGGASREVGGSAEWGVGCRA